MILSIKHKSSNHLFIQSTALFLLIAKFTSHKLWLGTRVFPIVPPFNFLLETPSFIHLLLYCISIILLAICIVKPQYSRIVLYVIITEIVSCTLDQNRWQPWEYQYLLMLFALWYNKKKEAIATLLIIIIISFTYIYSGLQKLNPHYLTLVWRTIFVEQFFHIATSISNKIWVLRLGYTVPFVELSLGVGLLIPATRKAAIFLIILMHIIISCVVGPSGVNENYTVLFWNFAMIAFVLIILKKQLDLSTITVYKNVIKYKFNWMVIAAWVMLPALNFMGCWDYFLSSSLYSGRVDVCFIKLQNPPPNFELSKYYKPIKEGDTSHVKTIAVQTWCNDELDVPPYPQKRMYQQIKLQWIKKYPNVKAKFWIIDRSKKKQIATELQ
jgi:hypothetical protein